MSDIFNLDSQGTTALEEEARNNPLRTEDVKPTAWANADEALKGLLRPSAAAGRTLMLAAPSVLEVFGTGLTDEGKEWYYKNVVDDFGSDAVDHWTADPASMGSASKALNVGTNVVGAVPQMFGMPGTFLATSGMDPATELLRQGVDVKTAGSVGGVNLLANALGMKIPASFGSKLLTRLTTGAGANLAVGTAADAASSGLLSASGHDDLARGYDASDPYARSLDVLMGVAFGWKEHVESPVMTRAQGDAVLTSRNNDHAHRLSMPGEATSTTAKRAHTTALTDAIGQMLRGEPVDIARAVRAEDFVLRPELQSAIDRVAPRSSDFEAAVARVLKDEGGFVNDADDRGGATNFGISSRAHPDVDVASLTRDEATNLYKERYWDAIGADTLPSELRGAAFDSAVNHGVSWTQRALEQADGNVAEFLRLREEKYRAIVAADPTQAKFMRGWMNRLGRYRETNAAGADLRERLVTDPDKLIADYAKLEDSQGGTVLNTDTARELSPEYLSDRTRSADVHEAASDTIKTIYEAKLARPTPEGREPVVMFTAGGTGAGKTSAIQAAGAALGKPEIVYDTNMNTLGSALDKVEQALDAGRQVRIAYVYRDPVEALTGGAIPRAQRQAEKFGTGRTVPLQEHARTHAGVRGVMDAIEQRYADDPRVELVAIDNSRGKGQQEIVELASLPKVEEDSLRERLQASLEEARSAGLAEDLYQGFSAAGRQASPRVGAGDGGRTPARDGQVTPGQTPLDAATQIAATAPDTPVIVGYDADGAPRYRTMAEALADIEAEQQRTTQDADAYTAAADCFIRSGGNAS